MKNFFLKLLVHFCKIQPQKHAKRTVLIVSTTGLGDALWATPAIRALKELNPEITLLVLTSKTGKAVLENNPHVEEIFSVKNPVFFSLFPLFFTLKKKKITDVLLFHTSQRPLLPFVSLLGASQVIGVQGENKGLDSLLSIAIAKQEEHEIQKRLRLVKAAGFNTAAFPLEVFFKEEIVSFSSSPLICIHPGAQNHFKEWDESHFIALGRKLEGTIIVTGTAKEKPRVEAIAGQIPGASFLIFDTLSSFASLLKKASLLIACDTGPMHLGFALKTPTLALFCPTDPKVCGPFLPQGKVLVIAQKKTCTPCLGKKCRDPFCLLQIGVDAVYDATKRFL